MSTAQSVLFAALLVFAGAPLALAEQQAGEKPGAVMTDVVTVTATVEAVDHDKRTVTLKGPKGKTVTLKVDQSVENFPQVKTGDQVEAQYLESTAIFVRKPGEGPSAEEVSTVGVAPRGQKPAGIMADTIEVTATVKAINYKKRTVTLEGPEGNAVTLKVDKEVKKLKQVKKGDEVVVRHTEAVAIVVRKPE